MQEAASTGIISNGPVYLNGLLSLFFIFLLPGFVIVRLFNIPNFPQRLFVVLLSSLTVNHLLVVLIATLGFSPAETYRTLTLALAVAWTCLGIMDANYWTAPYQLKSRGSHAKISDFVWLAVSVGVLSIAYLDLWMTAPRAFLSGDVAVSWNPWAHIWANRFFPKASYGYPQFVPTIWSITYIFTGSVEDYFAYCSYVILVTTPLVLLSMCLGRVNWLFGLLPVLCFSWFILEVKDPWMKSSFLAGYPDWTAAVAGFCGVCLFATNDSRPMLDGPRRITSILSIGLMLIAAATKPIYAILAFFLILEASITAFTSLQSGARNKFLAIVTTLVVAFGGAYFLNFINLNTLSLPPYAGDSIEKFERSARLLNENFSLPFRMAACLGIAMCPFVPRIRWLTIPLLLGFYAWGKKSGYDIRNVLGLLAICVVIPPLTFARSLQGRMRWEIPDGAIAVICVAMTFAATLTLGLSNDHLRGRFDAEQFKNGAGLELNHALLQAVERHCFILSGDAYVFYIARLQKYKDQLAFFHQNLPLAEVTIKNFDEKRGCTGVLYAPSESSQTVKDYVEAKAAEKKYVARATQVGLPGFVLLVSPSEP